MASRVKLIFSIAGVLLACFIVIVIILNCKSRNENEVVVIKIGEYEVKYHELENAVAKNKLINNIPLKTKLFDNYICAGLFIAEAKNNIPKISNKIPNYQEWAEDDLLIECYMNKKLDKPSYKLNENKLYYTCRDSLCVIDYFWVPKRNKEIADQIKERLINGARIDDMITSPIGLEWVNSGIRVYSNISQDKLLLTNNIQEALYKLKIGQTKILKSKSGLHIVRLIKRYYNFRRSDNISKQLSNLKAAIAVENGDTLLDTYTLNRCINIKREMLPLLNISFETVDDPSDSSVIAEVGGNKIYKNDLNKIISSLKIKEQVFFHNQSIKMPAVLFILNNYLIKQILRKIESKESETNRIGAFINKEIARCKNKDTVDFFKLLIKKSLQTGNPNSFVDFLKDGRSEQIINPQNSLKAEKYSMTNFIDSIDSYMNMDRNNLGVKLHYTNIEKLNVPKIIPLKSNTTIASKGKWKLYINDLKSIMLNLTPESRIELWRSDNMAKLIQYIALQKCESKDGSMLFINHKLLEKITIIGNVFDKIYPYYKASDTVASLFNTSITIQDLRDNLSILPEVIKSDLLDIKKRENAIKELLIRKYKADLAKKCLIDPDPDFIFNYNKLQYRELSELFYRTNIYIEPFYFNDEQLNYYSRKAINQIIEERLLTYLKKSAKAKRVIINGNALVKLNINVKESLFLKEIIYE